MGQESYLGPLLRVSLVVTRAAAIATFSSEKSGPLPESMTLLAEFSSSQSQRWDFQLHGRCCQLPTTWPSLLAIHPNAHFCKASRRVVTLGRSSFFFEVFTSFHLISSLLIISKSLIWDLYHICKIFSPLPYNITIKGVTSHHGCLILLISSRHRFSPQIIKRQEFQENNSRTP